MLYPITGRVCGKVLMSNFGFSFTPQSFADMMQSNIDVEEKSKYFITTFLHGLWHTLDADSIFKSFDWFWTIEHFTVVQC